MPGKMTITKRDQMFAWIIHKSTENGSVRYVNGPEGVAFYKSISNANDLTAYTEYKMALRRAKVIYTNLQFIEQPKPKTPRQSIERSKAYREKYYKGKKWWLTESKGGKNGTIDENQICQIRRTR